MGGAIVCRSTGKRTHPRGVICDMLTLECLFIPCCFSRRLYPFFSHGWKAIRCYLYEILSVFSLRKRAFRAHLCKRLRLIHRRSFTDMIRFSFVYRAETFLRRGTFEQTDQM